eukprot:s1328_g24.t4
MASQEFDGDTTTLALRGIAKRYSIEAILELLDAATGMPEPRRYDFVHMPGGGASHAGLAIVNFVDATSCRTCCEYVRDLQERGSLPGIKSIGRSRVQGFAENLAFYAAAVKQERERINERPLIFAPGFQDMDMDTLLQLFDMMVTAGQQAKACSWDQRRVTPVYGRHVQEVAEWRESRCTGRALAL